MINRYKWYILFSVAIISTVIWDTQTHTPSEARKIFSTNTIFAPQQRAVAGQVLRANQKVPAKTVHSSSEVEWKENLEANLKDLTDEPTEISIVHERSINWNDHGQIIPAEAVKVTLKGEKKSTNFRALVDANTGRIIQTWDQPVHDPVNPREGFGIKLDPRYDP
jgi:hypothetical protein